MKKNIGKALALYPAPLIVVGSMVDGKPNWTLVAHAGIMAHSHLMLSMVESHYTNRGILATKNVSVNVVDESWLKEADYMGVVSGNKTDKSGTFAYTLGEQGTPLIDKAKVSIECSVIDDYKLDGFDNFICRIENTYASETILNKAGKIDYQCSSLSCSNSRRMSTSSRGRRSVTARAWIATVSDGMREAYGCEINGARMSSGNQRGRCLPERAFIVAGRCRAHLLSQASSTQAHGSLA